MQILIVDDSKVNLKLYTRLINQDNYGESHCFAVSSDALEWARESDISLAIIDYNMPAPNGLEFIKMLRSMPGKEDVPILMVTADHAKELRYEALDCGANDFLTKPIDPVEFKARVKNMLALSESQRQLAETATWLADQVKAATAEIASRERETIIRLSLLAEQRNPETSAHLSRMSNYCQIIARGAGLSPGDQELLLTASPLHDVGKVAIPDSILLKPAKLTPREFAVIKRHPMVGYEILKDSTSPLLQLAAKVALTHHEKYDGSGYPQRLSGDQIPIVGRISALSDVFDALTSVRPYKKAWPLNDAVDEIKRNRGTHFDPQLVDVFFPSS
jgi:putative two-component system response regulator